MSSRAVVVRGSFPHILAQSNIDDEACEANPGSSKQSEVLPEPVGSKYFQGPASTMKEGVAEEGVFWKEGRARTVHSIEQEQIKEP